MELSSEMLVTFKSVVISVILNIVVSSLMNLIATKNQKNPRDDLEELNIIDQMMHMFVHHSRVLFSSSLIVAVVVFLSVLLATKIKLTGKDS